MFWYLLSLLVAITGIAYYYINERYSYWKKQNVPYPKPTPILGNYGGYILLKKHIGHVVQDICKAYPNEPYIGAFMGMDPTLIVQDPELIKLVTTKDFYYFNGREVSDYIDREVINSNLFSSHGDRWRVVRQNLTPIFSSGKMKTMFSLIEECSHVLENLIDEESKMSNIIDARTLMARFTMACIISCAFGIDGETMGKDFQNNPFKGIADSAFNQTTVEALKFTMRIVYPSVFYGLGQKAFPVKYNKYFLDLLMSVFKARQYKPSNRNDFVDFVLTFRDKQHVVGDSISNLKTGEKTKVSVPVTDEFLVAQCLIFFLAGFETSATTLSYTIYELAKNPDLLTRAQKEVDEYLIQRGNKLDYDCVNELPFVSACVDETLRMYSVVPVLTREVLEDHTLPSGVKLRRGVRIHIPVHHLHHHPKYFPEPEVYRPERFLGDAKKNITPNTYMPFGDGPRLCLGMRFAKMQILAGLVTVLKKYDLKLAADTPRKVKYVTHSLFPIPAHLLNLEFNPRDDWESRAYNKASK